MSPKKTFPVRLLPDGRAMVNLGSNARTAPGWNNVDSSLLLRFGRFQRTSEVLHKLGLLSEHRYSRIRKLDLGAVVWNLAKGIPWPDRTFDVVYHSHLLEHIDREYAAGFMAECLRVLKPGGTLRIAVPDLEQLARAYVRALDSASDPASDPAYEHALFEMFDQMVPRIPRERLAKSAPVRTVENIFLGDTKRTGALHRWMYDRFSLSKLLRDCGFTDVATFDHRTSNIEGWETFLLDNEPDGSPYKPGSVYVEGRRPPA